MLGIEALRGRVFTAEEDVHQDRVAVISESVWRTRFLSNPAVVGRQIRLEQLSFTVVGILPARQSFPEGVEVWLPLSYTDAALKTARSFHPLEVIGRLKPGVGLPQAQAEMDSVASRLASEYSSTNRTIGALAVPLVRQITGDARPALLVLWSAVGLVLLIVSANLAHLMMARALDRKREIAIRLALGAGRAEVLRQILSESLLLAIVGGALGVAIAAALTPYLRSLAEQRIPRAGNLTLDVPVLTFALGISAITGVLFGLPAWWQLRRAELNDVIKTGAASSWSNRRSATGAILMASEVALSVVVLFAAALVIRSFERTVEEDPGIRTKDVITVEVSLPGPVTPIGTSASNFTIRNLRLGCKQSREWNR